MAAYNPILITNRLAAATNATEDIRPLKPPVDIPSGWEWLWWVGGALLLIALVVALVMYFLRRAATAKAYQPPPEPAHVIARRRLEAAFRYISDPKQFTTEVSDVLRWYLEQRFQLRAPERTTEEFLSDLQRTLVLTPRHKESLSEFLQECDLVKFARFEPTEEAMRRLHASALRIVDETSYVAPEKLDQPLQTVAAIGANSEPRTPNSE